MSVSNGTVFVCLIIALTMPNWQEASGLRLLVAPVLPDPRPEAPAPPIMSSAVHHPQNPSKHSNTESVLGPFNKSPLNGCDVALPAAGLTANTSPGQRQKTHHAAAPAAAAHQIPAPPDPPPYSNATSDTANQSTPLSRDSIILIGLVFMLIVAVAVGAGCDGPTAMLLKAFKQHFRGCTAQLSSVLGSFGGAVQRSVRSGWQNTTAMAAAGVGHHAAAVATLPSIACNAVLQYSRQGAAIVCSCMAPVANACPSIFRFSKQQQCDNQVMPSVSAANCSKSCSLVRRPSSCGSDASTSSAAVVVIELVDKEQPGSPEKTCVGCPCMVQKSSSGPCPAYEP